MECSQDKDTGQESREQEREVGGDIGKSSVKGSGFILNALSGQHRAMK